MSFPRSRFIPTSNSRTPSSPRSFCDLPTLQKHELSPVPSKRERLFDSQRNTRCSGRPLQLLQYRHGSIWTSQLCIEEVQSLRSSLPRPEQLPLISCRFMSLRGVLPSWCGDRSEEACQVASWCSEAIVEAHLAVEGTRESGGSRDRSGGNCRGRLRLVDYGQARSAERRSALDAGQGARAEVDR